jgi:DNA repair exonuclease SbcCD ATPase subunit
MILKKNYQYILTIMKLLLNNFRCFKDITLDLPDNGTILLWGTSGIGKTTIFKAINFVLYGKEQKVVKHGEKKCKVELQFKDLIITRTKVPNHLIFQRGENSYFDDPAQKEIEKIFGRDFLLTSYMAQKGTENFFNLSSNEKSTFLQKLSLKDFDVESIRRKTRDIIKQRKDKLLINSTKYNMIKKDFIENIKEPKIKIDMKGLHPTEFLENENKLKDKVRKILKEKKLELSTVSNKLEKSVINATRLEEKEKLLTSLTTKLEDYNYLNDVNIITLTDTLSLYEKCILYYTLKKNCKDIKNEYDKMIEDERKKLQEDIDKTRDIINKTNCLSEQETTLITTAKNIFEKTKIKSLKDFEIKIDKIPNNEEKINSLSSSLKEKRDELSDLQLQLETLKKNITDLHATIGDTGKCKYKCPKCSIPVYIEGETLKEISENIDELKASYKDQKIKKEGIEITIKKLDKEIKLINNDIINLKVDQVNNLKLIEEYRSYINILKKEEYEPYNDKLNLLKQILDIDTENKFKLKTYQDNLKGYTKAIELTIEVLPHYLKKKREEVLTLKKKYEDIKNDLEDMDLESLDYYKSEIDSLKVKIEGYKKSISTRDQLLKEKATIEKDISSLKEGVDDVETLKNRIEELKDIILKKEETEDKLKLREEKITKYKEDLEIYNKQVKIKLELDNIKLEEEILTRALSTSEMMYKKINDAESYSLQNTIDTINTDLEEFISHFFGDNFSVRLDSFKETKDGDKKSSIEIIVMQDGEQIPIDTLSGGEFDRLALALFLAFNKTSKSNIILLDECLASLHSELVEDIVELIKTKLGDKLVLFTLHQANTGIFDTIVDIEKFRN